jgi:hypothetical protein
VFLLAVASCSSNNTTPSDLSPAAKAKWNDYCAYRATCPPAPTCP